MADITSITAAVASLKTAFGIAKDLLELKTSTGVQERVIELQRVILAAQQEAMTSLAAQAELLSRITELEHEIASLRAWGTEKRRYELKEVSPEAFAYCLKPDASTFEPPHWLCVRCYQDGRKSILQNIGRTDDRDNSIYRCDSCKAEFLTHWSTTPERISRKD